MNECESRWMMTMLFLKASYRVIPMIVVKVVSLAIDKGLLRWMQW